MKKFLRKWYIFCISILLMISNFGSIHVFARHLEYTSAVVLEDHTTVRFSMKYNHSDDNPGFAFVVGDFNGWQADDDYKLEWKNTGNNDWKITKDIRLTPGKNYKYKFIIDVNGYREWVTPTDGDPNDSGNATVSLPAITNQFTLKSSMNNITHGFEVFFAADLYETNGMITVLNPTYSIEPALNGVSISNDGKLVVTTPLSEGTEINVVARHENLVATKKIIYTQNQAMLAHRYVHYYRYQNDYSLWDVWAWNNNESHAYRFDSTTDFGVVANVLDKTDVIVRKQHWTQQEIQSTFETSKNIYYVENDRKVYTNFREAVNATKPKINAAIMDSLDKINVYLTHLPHPETVFKLVENNIEVAGVVFEQQDKQLLVKLNGYQIQPDKQYKIIADRQFNEGIVTLRNVLDAFSYEKELGVQYEVDGLKLNLWAPTAKQVNVLVYDTHESTQPHRFPLQKNGNVWQTKLDLSHDGKYYLYEITFADDNTTLAVDPYAVAVGINGEKAFFVDIKKDIDTLPTTQSVKPQLLHHEDATIYEMHIRDFTIDEQSGVVNKGKFLGVVEEGTYFEKDGKRYATGLDHLKELGITHVHLLPIYDFATVKEEITNDPTNRNWGYDPKNYNALEGSYSTDPNNPKVRIKEFREMVNRLHQNGIRVVLDVVYNHMYKTEYMDKVVPGYFFRSDDFGNYTNGSGTGNEMATERKMVSKFIVDSTKHWAENYNIDGLRFDLMELIDLNTMKKVVNEIKKIDPTNIIYGEPWKAADTPLKEELRTIDGRQRGQGFAMFNDNFRDAIRGDNSPGRGFVNGNNQMDINDRVKTGIEGAIHDFASDPEETINYVEVHDNYTIFDQIVETVSQVATDKQRAHYEYLLTKDKNTILEDNILKRIMLSQGVIFTAQGIPLMHSGTEFLRTKFGDHNSYKSSDVVNKLEWENKPHFNQVFEYQKGLLALRKAHPAFRMTNAEMVRTHLQHRHASVDGNVILTRLMNNANGDRWKNIVVIYNPTGSDYAVNNELNQFVAQANWKVVVNESQAGLTPLAGYDNEIVVKAHSMMVLYDEEKQAEKLSWNYLFADQSQDYVSPLEPTANDQVTLRFRAKADEVTSAVLHFYDSAHPELGDQTIAMQKVEEDAFYTERNYDKTKVAFWEVTLPESSAVRYYNFEVFNGSVRAWISGGTSNQSNNNGVSHAPNRFGEGIDYGFRIVPNYQTPNKNKEAILYQIMVDRFRNGDTTNDRSPLDPAVGVKPNDHSKPSEILNPNDRSKSGEETDHIWNNDFYNGDLVGVKEAIPYLKDELGITGLYLMPIFQAESNHKYDITSYDYVDKNFGGNFNFADLTKTLKDNDIQIILDGVFNHTGSLHPWLKKALDPTDNEHHIYRQFYFTDPEDQNVPEGYYGWKGFGSLPKLRFATDVVKDTIYRLENAVVKKYLKAPYFIDGWRLDAAEDVSENATTYEIEQGNQKIKNIEHIQSNLKIWNEVREAIKSVNPQASIIGEYWGDNPVWLNGQHWDGKMNYSGFYLPFIQNRQQNQFLGKQSLDNNGNQSVADIAKYVRNDLKKYPYQAVLNSTNSISTHDRPRFLDWDYTQANKEKMMELAATLQFTQIGIPMIYYGDEIGMQAKASRNHVLDQGNDPFNRDAFNWDRTHWNQAILSDYQKLIATRKAFKQAFVYGALEELKSHQDEKYLVYARHGKGEKAIIVLNNNPSNTSRQIQIEDMDRLGLKENDVLVDILTNQEVTVQNNRLDIRSVDMHAAVYVLKDVKPTTTNPITTLTDASDLRQFVKPVENVILQDKTLTWNAYNDSNTDYLLVRGYSNTNEVVFEKQVAKTENSFVFDEVNFSFVAIKAVANRSISNGTVDDIYRDSKYRIAALKTLPAKTNVPIESNIRFEFNEWGIQNVGKVELKEQATVVATVSVENNTITLDPSVALKPETTYTVTIPALTTRVLQEKNYTNAELSNIEFEFTTEPLQEIYEATNDADVPSTHVKVSFEIGEGITASELKVYHVRKGTTLTESILPTVVLAPDYQDLRWSPTFTQLTEDVVYRAQATRLAEIYEATNDADVPSTHVKVSFEIGEGITASELKVYHVRKGTTLTESILPTIELKPNYENPVWQPEISSVLQSETTFIVSASKTKVSELKQVIGDRTFSVQNDTLTKGCRLIVRKIEKEIPLLKGKTYEIYDLHVECEGKVYPININTIVTVDQFKDKISAIYYLKNIATLEDHPFKQTNDLVSFTTNHFSEYVFVYEKEASSNGPQNDSKKDEQIKPLEQDKNQLQKPNTKKPTETADKSEIWMYVSLCMMLIVVMLKRKPK